MIAARALALAAVVFVGCSHGPTAPAALDTKNESCGHCRMAVSDGRFAAQIVAPGEEPKFFDDVGCLRDFLAAKPQLPRGAVAYVADHRTKTWVLATKATYSKTALETPMMSHLVAHADAASRQADTAVPAGATFEAAQVFAAPPPEGTP